MLYTIENDLLRVDVSEAGAEIQSILGCDGTQYLWQGDSRYWADRAINIFPYVARLTQGSYCLDGELYRMQIHGIAPYSHFDLVEQTGETLVLELISSQETRKIYPRAFSFRIGYRLAGNSLQVAYQVENRDEKTMYFGLGGHPGFNVPLEADKGFEDYRLRFSDSCQPVRVGFTQDCYLNGQDQPFPLKEDRILPLSHSLFDGDAIVLREMAHQVTLEAEGGGHTVTVTFPDQDYLGIWHCPRSDAPYVCIEPWSSLPSHAGKIAVLEEQKDLISLAPGGIYQTQWQITLGFR